MAIEGAAGAKARWTAKLLPASQVDRDAAVEFCHALTSFAQLVVPAIISPKRPNAPWLRNKAPELIDLIWSIRQARLRHFQRLVHPFRIGELNVVVLQNEDSSCRHVPTPDVELREFPLACFSNPRRAKRLRVRCEAPGQSLIKMWLSEKVGRR